MKKRIAGTVLIGMLLGTVVAGCGGGSSSTPAAPVTKTAAKSSAEKSVTVTSSLDNEIILGGGNLAFSRVSAAARLAVTVVETDDSITYTDEVDSESGCTRNGTITFTSTSNSTASISGSIVETNCTNSFNNGTSTLSGTMSIVDDDTANVTMTTSFAQSGSSLVITFPITGVVGLNDDSFTQSSTDAMTLNGTDSDGYIYSSFVVTDAGSGSISIAGRMTDSTGFYIIYSNSTIASDNSATLNFKTSDGVTGAMAFNADGSGSGTLTQTSNNAELLTVSWDATGAGTITYADETTDQVTMSI